MPQECNTFLRCIEKDCDILGVKIKCSKEDTSIQVNGFFTGNGIDDVLETKFYRSTDSSFSFLASFIDRAPGNTTKVSKTVAYLEYSASIRLVTDWKGFHGGKPAETTAIEDKVAVLKKLVT